MFLAAHRLNYGVFHVADHHPCAEDQRFEDDIERAHGLRQLSENLRGLLA
jgi:hypothetical protein